MVIDQAAAALEAPPNNGTPPARPAPWRGRKRVEEARTRFVAVRCTDAEYATLVAAAERAGLSVGAYLRAVGCGDAGVRAVRRPPVEKVMLAQVLGVLGQLVTNVGQLSEIAQRTNQTPSAAQLDLVVEVVRQMAKLMLKALGRGDQG